ncbi:hypothetical protein M413DRAFT_392188 [Hebeloma cylindrosporum]|uniref:F-box domain-containing protein n=1 Tax=Hebeloma cylindrosporum TaxID=76867 RepID=A0A0C3C1X6_HEBCY|nr:hypothetical protein M413DRAFT_392188 [Hebeloma cylindrosporum h7]
MSPISLVFEGSRQVLLPQELTDQIINHLWDDMISLKACSLVCWSWFFSSRIHIFGTLVVNSKTLDLVATFITETSRCTILPYVKRIEFQGIPLPSAEPQFPTRLGPLSHFTSMLTHLHLHHARFTNFLELIDLICSFRILQSIGLDSIDYLKKMTTDQAVADTKRALPPSANSLRIRDSPLRAFLSWVVSHRVSPKITTLDVGPIEEDNVHYVGTLLSLLGPDILHLSLAFGFGKIGHICTFETMKHDSLHGDPDRRSYEKPAHPTIKDRYLEVFHTPACHHLATLVSLKSLRINNLVNGTHFHHSTATFWSPRFLASINSHNIQRVVFGIKLSRAGELDSHAIRWDFLDEVFASEAYTNLHMVEFDIGGRVNLDGLSDLITYKLPVAAKRGLLRFSKVCA